MANEIPGINVVVAQGGTAIVDQQDATLTSTPELAESVVKNTNFPNRLPGDQDWTLSLEGQIPDDTGKDALANGNAGLQVEVDTGSGLAYETVAGVQSLTLTLEQEFGSVPPGIDEATGWSYYVPLRQSWEVDVEAHYYDPANEAVYEAIHGAREAGEVVPGKLNVLGVTMEGDLAADEFELSAGTDDPASQSLPFMGSGSVSQTSSFESTIEGLVGLYFSQSTATMALQHREGGSPVTGSTSWEGDGYLSSAEISLERNAFPTLSTEIQGNGPLERITQ